MKNKIFLVLFVGIFLINFVSAGGIGKVCIDVDAPTWTENSTFTLISSLKDIQLSWTPATDVPECSGISHYEIYRGFNNGELKLITNTSDNFYFDSVQDYGTYEYMIHAFDLVGHLESNGISKSITISSGSSGGTTTTSGGGGGGIDNLFSCGEWEECVDGTQIRICVEIGGSLPDRIESRDCFSEFEPLSSGDGDLIEISSEIQETTGFLSPITGAVTGFVKTGTGMVSIILILGLAGAFVVVRTIRKR